jgi:hypothetical protein
MAALADTEAEGWAESAFPRTLTACTELYKIVKVGAKLAPKTLFEAG